MNLDLVCITMLYSMCVKHAQGRVMSVKQQSLGITGAMPAKFDKEDLISFYCATYLASS